MSKVLILFGIGAVVIIGVIILTSSKQPPSSTVPTISQIQPTSRYGDYSLAAYQAAVGKKRVLYFYATWCPTCSVANEDFTVNTAQIPEDIAIFRTDYDKELDLKRKYAVTYQHTFVQVDEAGNELAKWNGGGLSELLQNLK
ncbi:MAG: thioredoxin [Microgenomates group bacterium Gr01-1014_16]|nr:MAG: thioredoxin [Microgenomates group bacterium Gr01-1014_16]